MAGIKLDYNRMKIASLRKSAAGTGSSFGFGSGGGTGSSPFGGSTSSNSYGRGGGGKSSHGRYNPVYDDLSEGTIIEQFMPVDPRRLHRIWRRIYLQDPVAGPAVELYKDLPWSDFSMLGINDPIIAKTYTDAMNAIGINELLPEIAAEFLTMGKVIGHLTMNESKGHWDRCIIHDPDWIRVTPIPLPGFEPKLDIIATPEMRQWSNSKDPRDVDAQEEVQELVDMIRRGMDIPLPPEQTFYLPRKTAPYDVVGASAYTRIIMFVAYEKALVNSTIAASRRRASRIRHITAGIDDVWEPSPGELDELSNLFMQADEDPVGAIVVTRSGVTANEVGGGSPQDILKISDEWQFLLQGKLNALGVSEAFLTGEACLVGDSLISTTQGLLRIGDLHERREEPGSWKDLDLEVDSRFGSAKTSQWLYNGYRPTLKIRTQTGNEIQSTGNHPVLVLNPTTGYTDWKRTDALVEGDLLCISTNKVTKTSPLSLNLELHDDYHGASKMPIKPSIMTPELAYILGCVVAEGSCTCSTISVSSSNMDLLNKLESRWESVFGLKGFLNKVCSTGDSGVVNGVPYTNNYDCYDYVVSSIVAKQWLVDLGLKDVKSKEKQVPWSILQADEESQLAFIAAYLDCDGSIHPKNGQISFCSHSKHILKEIQAILSSHGYISSQTDHTVALTCKDSLSLWQSIQGYMCKSYPVGVVPTKACNRFGVPNGFVKNFIKSRKVRHSRHGSYYLNDNGVEIVVRSVRSPLNEEKRFLYDRYTSGDYDSWLENLALISSSMHSHLVSILDIRYHYSSITSIEDGGNQHVYDISMAEGEEPAFVAGGLVVHNSYNTMESLLTVFLEKIKAFRNYFVRKLLLDKILKPLAVKHNYRHRKQADLDHRVRTGSSDADNYILPSIVWEKSLRPVGDRDYLEILETMESKGIPITLQTWSGAAGFDVSSETEQFDEDIRLRRQMSNQKKKVMEQAPETASGGAGGEMGMGGMGGMDMGMGDMGMGDMGGMDMGMGGGMGGMDMGMGGDLGGMEGGGLELPQVGASFRAAAAQRMQEDKIFLQELKGLPIWAHSSTFLGVRFDRVELTIRRLLDHMGSYDSTILTKRDEHKILRIGDATQNQVLAYILNRVGIIKNGSLSKQVAIEIQEQLSNILMSKPQVLVAELSHVASCLAMGSRNILERSAQEVEEDARRAIVEADARNNKSIRDKSKGMAKGAMDIASELQEFGRIKTNSGGFSLTGSATKEEIAD